MIANQFGFTFVTEESHKRRAVSPDDCQTEMFPTCKSVLMFTKCFQGQ